MVSLSMRQFLVLAYLDGVGSAYGLEVVRQLEMCSGVFYPAARKLVQHGLLEADPEEIDEFKEGRRARVYYSLTPQGRDVLEQYRSLVLS